MMTHLAARSWVCVCVFVLYIVVYMFLSVCLSVCDIRLGVFGKHPKLLDILHSFLAHCVPAIPAIRYNTVNILSLHVCT